MSEQVILEGSARILGAENSEMLVRVDSPTFQYCAGSGLSSLEWASERINNLGFAYIHLIDAQKNIRLLQESGRLNELHRSEIAIIQLVSETVHAVTENMLEILNDRRKEDSK